MSKNSLENRFKTAKRNIEMNFKFLDIRLGKIEYTNNDIDELIKHYIEEEQYRLCDKLIKLKQK
jgi:hypothetical protein